MKRVLDIDYGIPYCSNSTDQLFEWYMIYKDGAIILENDGFSKVSFNDIPKTDIKRFGLLGCGFHLSCDFINRTMSIYNSVKNNEFLCNCIYRLSNAVYKNNSTPFQLKGFIYDSPIKGVSKELCLINKFYLGLEENIIVDGTEFINKIYFSINITDYPNSIGLMYRLIPSNNVYPLNKKYRLLVSNYKCTIIDGVHKAVNNERAVDMYDNNLKCKSIFRINPI